MEKPFTLKFPIGGLDKSKGYSTQPPFTTVDAMNVWPSDWTEEGRERGGTRSALSPFITNGESNWPNGMPLNWCPVNYVKSGLKRGIAVTATDGVYVHVYGTGAWEQRITFNSVDFATSTVLLQTLYSGVGVSGKSIILSDLTQSNSSEDLTAEQYPPDENGEIFDKGQAPLGCGIVHSHGGRLYASGDVDNPQVLYASRDGNAKDWDYSAVDEGAAWANSGGKAGKISEHITSLFTHMDNECLVVGCTDSYYSVIGNPRAGGRVRSLSKAIGPLMQSAICKVGRDDTYFFSRDGLQKIRPGCGDAPIPISRKNLPSDLVGLDPGSGDRVSIAYDIRWAGIHIYAHTADADTYWFYDLRREGFWPMGFDEVINLAVNYPAQATEEKSGLIAIGDNIYQYEETTEAIDQESYLFYGPFALGSPFTEGILTEIFSVLAVPSGDVKWSIYTGETAQHALADPRPFTGTWKVNTPDPDTNPNAVASGLNYKSNPAKRGVVGYLKLESIENSRWSPEEIMCVRRMAGRRTVG